MNLDQFFVEATNWLSLIGFVLFVALLGAVVFKMGVRVSLYLKHKQKPHVVLRRDFALLGALFITFGALAVFRFFGIQSVYNDPFWRFAWVLFSNAVALAALGYWTWAEFFVIGHEGRENE